MMRNTLAVDDLDYQLVNTVNTSYGIGISNAVPNVTGTTIPKVQTTGFYTSNIQIYGSVQTPLRLAQPLTTVSGDLVLTSANNTVNFGGSIISNYITPTLSTLDLPYQMSTPANPPSNTIRIYANDSGMLSFKRSSGASAHFDISGLSANRIYVLPDETIDLVGTDTTQTLTNKVISSASNTIRIEGTAITSLINQPLLTSSSPSFVSATLTNQLTMNTGATHPITVNQSSTTTGNDLMFQKSGVNVFSIGTNETSTETYSWTPAARDYKIGTNNTERLRIPSAGIASDNAVTNILGLQSNTLVYKNNVMDLSSAQTLTNKTINTAGPNTIQVGGTNITALVDQALLTSSSPTFVSTSTTGTINEFGGKFTQQFATLTTTVAGSILIDVLTVPTDTTRNIVIYLMAFCFAGSNLNGTVGVRQILKIVNIAGTLTVTSVSFVSNSSFSSGLNVAAAGVNTAHVSVGGIDSNSIRWTSLIKIYDE